MPEECDECAYREHCVEMRKYFKQWITEFCLYNICPVCGEPIEDSTTCHAITPKA